MNETGMAETESIERIPERSVVLIEEESGSMKDFFAHKVAITTAAEGKKVVYLTSHFAEDIKSSIRTYSFTVPETFQVIDGARPGDNLLGKCTGDLCVIDPFSSLFIDRSSADLLHLFSTMRELSRKGGSFLLVSDMGVLPPQQEHLIRALSDGVIRFMAVVEGDKIKRYMRVLKMRGITPIDKMILFTVTDEGLQIDTRERLG
jgi:KaiC/GvpD/RAD55 family RecA-like ATPase